MKIAITRNPRRSDENCNIVINHFKRLLEKEKIEYFDLGAEDKKPDVIAVFGGDGTILATAKYATENQIPILAINVGTVGFLSSFEEKDLQDALKMILNGDLKVTEKTTLKILTSDGEEYFALNDAVIERQKNNYDVTVVSKLNFAIDDKTVYKLSCDGLIVSTPTGSTAYSLSAGGVILTPDLKSFIATPICSHSLYTRPIVFRDDKTVTVTVMKNSCSSILSVDGRGVKTLKSGDSVTIVKHEKTLKIVDCNDNFFSRLIKKLGK
ncbi:MAG: NAD(+)/NADH kinase [Clostridia bacterium]|nr:NAD(+)/NADH kinase [Clostridia bacterium]